MVSALFRSKLVSSKRFNYLNRQHFCVQTLNWRRLAFCERLLHWGVRTRPLCCVLRGFSKDSQSDWLRVNLIQTKNPEFYYLQIIQNWFTFTLDVATQMQFSLNKKATLHNLIIPAIHWVVIFNFIFCPKIPSYTIAGSQPHVKWWLENYTRSESKFLPYFEPIINKKLRSIPICVHQQTKTDEDRDPRA